MTIYQQRCENDGVQCAGSRVLRRHLGVLVKVILIHLSESDSELVELFPVD